MPGTALGPQGRVVKRPTGSLLSWLVPFKSSNNGLKKGRKYIHTKVIDITNYIYQNYQTIEYNAMYKKINTV